MRDRLMGSLLAWGVCALILAGGVARGQDGLRSELDYELGFVVKREIVSLGHGIVGEMIDPHFHGRRACYEPHLPDVPPLDITYIEQYTNPPSEVASRYRHAHHHGNVVEEHAHHSDGFHDHYPGSPLDYRAAYEHYQRTAQADEFDEYVFVTERHERKVPQYRIHGSPQPKPRRNDDPSPAESDAAPPVDSDPPDGDPGDDTAAVDDVAADAPLEALPVASGVVESVFVDDPGEDRIVDRYRKRRRDARDDFDKQTNNRLDPSRNRRDMKSRADRQREQLGSTSLSERIEAERAALGAGIEQRAINQSNRLDQRMIDATRAP